MTRRRLIREIRTVTITFVGGVLGFGITTLVVGAARGTPVGIALAAAIYVGSGMGIDLGICAAPLGEVEDRAAAKMLWVVAAVVWFVVSVPVAGFLAPHYALHGLVANVAAIAIVYLSDSAVSHADPWRKRSGS